MKKGLLSIGMFAFLALGMVSCGGVDGDKVGGEYCECMKKKDKEKENCVNAWIEQYKDAGATEEEAEKMMAKMLECGDINEILDHVQKLDE